jgi:FAD/FMN-containing dehydrogenase
MPDWHGLEGAMDGGLALPGSAAFEAVGAPFNARFQDVEPQAIASCENWQDVSEAISFVRQEGLEAAVRSGGHSFAGHSSTSGLVIDVTPMHSVSVSAGIATVGAGARLGEVYDALQEHDLAIPAGTCPTVGVAGLVLGGGLGILGRAYGVTSDSLLEVQLVLADGRVLACDEHHNEDLFWALRGAGSGNFGVVTSFVFRTVPAPVVTNAHLSWPISRAAAVIDAWQAWGPRGPDELAASLKVTAGTDVDQLPSVEVYAAVLESEIEAADLLDELVVRVGAEPIASFQERMSFPETRRYWAQLGDVAQNETERPAADSEIPVSLYSRSEFFNAPLPPEAIGALVASFLQGRLPGESRELDFMPWGGAYNRVPQDATAFVHRDELFLLKHSVVVAPDAAAEAKRAAHRHVNGLWASVHPWGSGRVFQNFADPDLRDWASAYYGPNLDRLVGVKEQYDPTNILRFHQSLRR